MTRPDEHRPELESMVNAVGVRDSDRLQRRVVEVDAHHLRCFLVETPMAAKPHVRYGDSLE
jgi:hypothetical protein